MDKWHNYVTEEDEWHKRAPENLRDYIPQDPNSLAQFDQAIHSGLKPIEAMIRVLRRINKKQIHGLIKTVNKFKISG